MESKTAPLSAPSTSLSSNKTVTQQVDIKKSSLYRGRFDLYSTRRSVLKDKYLPKGAKTPLYEAVYTEILTWQAKSDKSGQIALRSDANSPDLPGASGMFSCLAIANPMSDEPFEYPIHIHHGQGAKVHFSASEAAHSSGTGQFDGYTARLEMDTDDADECMGGAVSSGAGQFKMHKVWEKVDGDVVKELFEGYWDLKVKNGPLLKRKGWGGSLDFSTPFWAVRARRDKEGNEIGIDAGTGYFSSSAAFGGLDFDEDDEEDYSGHSEEEGLDDMLYGMLGRPYGRRRF